MNNSQMTAEAPELKPADILHEDADLTAAEQSIVGRLLSRAECPQAKHALDVLSGDGCEFADPLLREAFRAISALALKGEPHGVAAVSAAIAADEGAVDGLLEMAAKYAATAEDIKGNVARLAARYDRKLLVAKAEAAKSAWAQEAYSLTDMRKDAQDIYHASRPNRGGTGSIQKTDVAIADTILKEINAGWDREKDGKPAAGITTGLRKLDRVTAGISRKEQMIVGARTSVGKTAMLGQMCLGMALAGLNVGVWILEMSANQIRRRLAINIERLDGSIVRNGRFKTESQREEFNEGLAKGLRKLVALPIWFYERHGTIDEVIESMGAAKRRFGIDVFLIDYLQAILAPENDRRPRNEQVGSAVLALHEFAKSENVALVTLAQINRAAMGNPDAKPELENLKDSGDIEQGGDIVVLLHRPKVEVPLVDPETGEQLRDTAGELAVEKRHGDDLYIDVAKHRDGGQGTVVMKMVAQQFRLEEHKNPPPIPVVPQPQQKTSRGKAQNKTKSSPVEEM